MVGAESDGALRLDGTGCRRCRVKECNVPCDPTAKLTLDAADSVCCPCFWLDIVVHVVGFGRISKNSCSMNSVSLRIGPRIHAP